MNSPMARRKPNVELRPREYLTEPEIERLMTAALSSRASRQDVS
jgi:hypothetical protein